MLDLQLRTPRLEILAARPEDTVELAALHRDHVGRSTRVERRTQRVATRP